MATAKTSADIKAPVPAVYAVIADPTRLPDWDPTDEAATSLHGEPASEPAFGVRRTLANRGMDLACRVVQAQPPTAFAFACGGGSGERIRETFELVPGRDGAGTADGPGSVYDAWQQSAGGRRRRRGR